MIDVKLKEKPIAVKHVDITNQKNISKREHILIFQNLRTRFNGES